MWSKWGSFYSSAQWEDKTTLWAFVWETYCTYRIWIAEMHNCWMCWFLSWRLCCGTMGRKKEQTKRKASDPVCHHLRVLCCYWLLDSIFQLKKIYYVSVPSLRPWFERSQSRVFRHLTKMPSGLLQGELIWPCHTGRSLKMLVLISTHNSGHISMHVTVLAYVEHSCLHRVF